jgi:hypothetical protein
MVETVLSKDQIIAAFKRLKAEDQLSVYLALREVVPDVEQFDDGDAEISDELKAELTERHRRMLENPDANLSAEDVVRKMHERLGSRR